MHIGHAQPKAKHTQPAYSTTPPRAIDLHEQPTGGNQAAVSRAAAVREQRQWWWIASVTLLITAEPGASVNRRAPAVERARRRERPRGGRVRASRGLTACGIFPYAVPVPFVPERPPKLVGAGSAPRRRSART
eukprot:349894-Chlamydomonas_euryale.AAC.3